MNKWAFTIILFLFLPVIGWGQSTPVGLEPVPVLNNVTVQTVVSYDSTSNLYTYTYTVANPSSNTGAIWSIDVDMTAPLSYVPSGGSELTLPFGAAGAISFSDLLSKITPADLPDNAETTVFGIQAPPNWLGYLTVNHTGGFSVTDSSALIEPGQTVGGLSIISAGPPTIRTMTLKPNWQLDVGTGNEATVAEEVQAQQVLNSITVSVNVLGPSWVYPGFLEQWDELQGDLNKMIQLGWIPSATLASSIQSQLQTARNIINQDGVDAYQATAAIQTLLSTVTSSTSTQRTQDAYNLLFYNVTALLNALLPTPQPPQPPPPTPKATIINPASHVTMAPVGASVTITAQVVDLANNDAPLANFVVPFDIVNGPDAGETANAITNQNGQATFTYAGAAKGIDTVDIDTPYASTSGPTPLIIVKQPAVDAANVIWQGGGDLIISEFTPPVIIWDGHSPLHITDSTKNIGDTTIGSSTTQYYLSTTKPVDPSTALVVGSRPFPSLTPGQSNHYESDVTLPASAGGPGTYYLTACANGNRTVIETNYSNNCQIKEFVMALAPATPPNCSNAGPTITSLWPPNHKMVGIGVTGVTDPNNLPVTITITGIQQDEPVEEPGSGNTEPDGAGVGTSTAQVRSERSGTGTGRIYFIAFSASDSDGGSCTATVQVYVPHDQGQGTVPVDTGQRYDSTQ